MLLHPECSSAHVLAGKAISNVPDMGSLQEKKLAPMYFPITQWAAVSWGENAGFL